MGKPSTPESHGRIVAYDALRVFAIATVVAIHTLMPYRETVPAEAPVRVFDDLLHYAVPLFVFISGALVWSRPWRGGPGAYRDFIARRAAVIGLPYLAWALLYAAVWAAQNSWSFRATELAGLLLSGHIWYHLYFVPMLLTFYLLTPAAARLSSYSPELMLGVAYGIRILLGRWLIDTTSALDPLLGQYATHVVTHLPHMALGGWFALRLAVLPRWVRAGWPAMLASGTAILWAASLYGLGVVPTFLQRMVYPAGMALTVLGMALGALALEPRYARWSRQITAAGSLAFGVYFVHPLFLLLVNRFAGPATPGSPWAAWWFAPLAWAAVTAASFATAEVLSRTRGTAWLVGLMPRRRP